MLNHKTNVLQGPEWLYQQFLFYFITCIKCIIKLCGRNTAVPRKDVLQLREHKIIYFEKENKVSTKEGSFIHPQSVPPPSCLDQTGSEWFYNLSLQAAEFKYKQGAGTRVKGEIEPPLDGKEGEHLLLKEAARSVCGWGSGGFSPLQPTRCITTGDLRRRAKGGPNYTGTASRREGGGVESDRKKVSHKTHKVT